MLVNLLVSSVRFNSMFLRVLEMARHKFEL